MAHRSPLARAFCSVIPGLGQVCNGETARGAAFFLGTYLSFLIFILGIIGMFGFGWYFDALIGFLGLAVILWAGSIYDAYNRAKRMNNGELEARPANKLHIILFLVMVIVLLLILVAAAGVVFLMAIISMMESNVKMHEIPPHNITVSAEKNGTTVLLSHVAGNTSGLLEYMVRVNGVVTDQSLNITGGSTVLVNGTAGRDHVTVDAYWLTGAKKTILDTYI